ncbi:hypothetical protein C2I18_02205 [Paenibacillus sp. PK3_47]|uniref:PstS family phosphate ABC transporter substrate-binding protein n=1 Tax=Paenibacillus sp. PK3_47 TaxID=2072642 RepID=UPI00201E736A|nr:substrate-binding domain-containing protein [Paenibacillus sp. PK3_47]UQZ32469.1 hypothetical protein C2I18_02205 [Paenibacillus sp. PK3_47]
MKRSFLTNLLYSILAVIPIAFAAFIGSFITAVLGGMKFYTPLTLIVAGGLAVYAVISIFDLMTRRVRGIIMASFAGLCLLATAGYEINKAYINSITVNEQEIYLGDYTPFAENTKAVSLGQTAAYRIGDRDNLPKLDGATALYPLYSAFVRAVYPQDDYQPYDYEDGIVLCSSTAEAYKRLIAGEADIIFAAAPSVSQQKAAKRAGKELQLTPVGREAFVFFVNNHNTVDGLTTEQIKKIYSGEITNWKEAGGKNEKIRAFQRDEDSGSQTMLEKIMEDSTLMTPPKEDVADVMSGIISRTANYRNYQNSLGFSFLFYASEMNGNDKIKLLAIDGVRPDKQGITSGKYPFATEFYAVTAGSSNPNIRPFIEWIQSAEGQELVEKTGYTSLK